MALMKWIVLGLLVVVALGIVALLRRRRTGRSFNAPAGSFNARATSFDAPAARRKCLKCHGTGWIGGEPERTFNFVGDGFEDKHTPATACPVCGGTGTLAAP
jgi:hypothetical protein